MLKSAITPIILVVCIALFYVKGFRENNSRIEPPEVVREKVIQMATNINKSPIDSVDEHLLYGDEIANSIVGKQK